MAVLSTQSCLRVKNLLWVGGLDKDRLMAPAAGEILEVVHPDEVNRTNV